jgi:DNA-binding protein Fis
MILGLGSKRKGNIYPLIMKEVESCIINLVLQETNYNLFIASKMLGISRSTLYRKMQSIGISKKDKI